MNSLFDIQYKLIFNINYYIELVCIIIFIAAFIDACDGKVARKLGTSGDFGKQLDSLADLVSFCMVASLLIFVHYMLVLPDLINFKALIFLSSFPLIFGAIRLAKYNALREMRDSEKYLGLPTPANAIFICSSIMFTYNLPYRSIVESDNKIFNWLNDVLSNLFINEYMLLSISILSSILLMSKINYDKFPLISFKINRKNNVDLIKVIIFLFILGSSFFAKSYDIVLLIFISIYIFGNMIKYIINLIKR